MKDKRHKDAVSVQMKLDSQEQADVSHLKERQKWEALTGKCERNRETSPQKIKDEIDSPNSVERKTDGESRIEIVEPLELGETKGEENGVKSGQKDTVQHDDREAQENDVPKKKNLKSKLSRKELMEQITRQVREKIQAEERQEKIPLVRSQGQINVTFTPRVFPTPTRESMAPEEEEWLQKQAVARQACGFIAKDLRPEENNIAWVTAKAEEMYEQANYLGAVSAYSHGASLCPELATMYLGRGRAQLMLNNLHKAVDDASEAIKLLTPPCESNRKDRIEAHLIRGRALVGLKVPKMGVLEFEHALTLDPLDSELKQELTRVQDLASLSDESEGPDFGSPPVVVTQ